MARVFPLKEYDSLDLRDGTVIRAFVVQHTTAVASDLWVDQTAYSAAVLPADMSVSAQIVAQETAESAGISVTNDSATDGVKEVTIASGVASGTYLVVVRFAGSGAGIGSYKRT